MGIYYEGCWVARREVEKFEMAVDIYKTPFMTDTLSYKTIHIRLKEAKKGSEFFRAIYWIQPLENLNYNLYCTPCGLDVGLAMPQKKSNTSKEME